MRRTHLITFALLIAAFVVVPFRVGAQQAQTSPDLAIDAATRAAVIDILLKELIDGYVFPETAKKMEADIRSRVAAKEYDSVTSAQEFAKKLTTDLQSVSKDKHVRVRYSHTPIPMRKDRGEPTEAEREQARWMNKRINFGFEK